MTDFDVLTHIVSGDPVPFDIDGVPFALRQPSPLEMDRARLAQQRAADRALADYRAEGLADEPVSDALVETKRLYNEALEAAYQQANADGDTAAMRQVAEDMERAEWPRNLAEERSRDYARRAIGRWIVDNLLTGDKSEFKRLTAPDPLNRAEVAGAISRLLQIINHDPNSNRRTD